MDEERRREEGWRDMESRKQNGHELMSCAVVMVSSIREVSCSWKLSLFLGTIFDTILRLFVYVHYSLTRELIHGRQKASVTLAPRNTEGRIDRDVCLSVLGVF